MKKLLLAIVVVFIASYSFAQVSLGVKAGLNLSDQKFSSNGTTVGHELKPGFHAGLIVTAMINEKFGIQPEVLFSMQGTKLESGLFSAKYVTSFNYLAVPILARYNFTDRLSIHVGPQIGFLMSAEVEDSNGGQTTDVKDDYKSTDISGALGGEFEIVSGLGAGVRYVFGLTDIHKDEVDNEGKVKNSNVQIYLKWKFGGKK